MRILIVSQYFWPENFRVNDLAVGLRDRGHEITVLTGLPNYPEGRLYSGYHLLSATDSFDGIPIVRVPLVSRGNSRGLRLAANYSSFAASASLLGPLRCRGPFDAIFVFEPSPITVGLPAVWLRRWHNVPLLFWVLDLWPESLAAAGAVRSPWLLRPVEHMVRYIYARCDRVLVQSRGFIPHITRQGVPDERLRYFPSWAEELFQPLDLPPDAPERRELPPGFRILFAGNLGASQSLETILDAAERTRGVSQIRWVLMGDGRQRAAIEAQIRERRLQATVSLTGPRPLETMPRYFAAADALLVTLKRDPIFARTIPGKVQSYLACRKPILGALDGEGAACIRTAGAGLVCAAEDAAGLAASAVALYRASAAERAEMGRRGRAYFDENFHRERLLDRLQAMFYEAVAEHRATGALRRGA